MRSKHSLSQPPSRSPRPPFCASKRSPKRRAYGPLATFYRRYSRSFYRSFGLRICSKFYAKPTEISSENAKNFVSGELAAELGELENERVNLVAAIKKANLIGIDVGVCAGAAITYLFRCDFRHGDRRACLYFYDDVHYRIKKARI